ncbi:uncharacterized protein LOC142178921, partial [Nicotiana tabacum]|uniref:Uncharacterized protein LOC142178921 n=1 Tax=Nicotiana tabacum TaxID=4097 RepID=A0AC58U651_TOBAC
MKVGEMSMFRWMCEHTRLDKIKNEDIQEKLGLAPIDEKMREAMVRWFGHMRMRSQDDPVMRFQRLSLAVMRRGRGRPTKYWSKVIRQDTTQLQSFEDMALYRK